MSVAEQQRAPSPSGDPLLCPIAEEGAHGGLATNLPCVTRSSLVEQLGITDLDIARWKALVAFGDDDVFQLSRCKRSVNANIQAIIDAFYAAQTSFPEIAIKIGDAETMARMQGTMRQYVLELFEGYYDLTYVGNRLRIGRVHQRMGIEPRVFLAAMSILEGILEAYLLSPIEARQEQAAAWRLARKNALRKLMVFDSQLVIETYILSLSQEIDAARRRVEAYATSLESAVAERTRRLEELSVTDQLTGLGNQRGLYLSLRQELGRTERYGTPLSVIYLDVNGFKRINDEQGHLAGDDLLKSVGETIASVVRQVDVAFRYGGDEFCIVAPSTDADGAERLCHRLIAVLEDRHASTVSLAIGIAETGADGPFSPDGLLRQADRAMYEAKRQAHRFGGSRIAFAAAVTTDDGAADPGPSI